MNAVNQARYFLDPAAVRLLAPGGRLRVAINVGNPVLANRRPDGTPFGVTIDLAQALGEALRLPIELEVFESAGASVDAVTHERADIGFFAIDPVRGQGIAFTPAYVIIEGAYLVRDDSPLRSNDEVDRLGTRVVVGKGSAYDLFLTRELKHAQIVRSALSREVVDDFVSQKMDVAAGVKRSLEVDSARHEGLRLLPGNFMLIQQAMGLPKGRCSAARNALRDFVEHAKACGFVDEALRRHGIEGAQVAPAAT